MSRSATSYNDVRATRICDNISIRGRRDVLGGRMGVYVPCCGVTCSVTFIIVLDTVRPIMCTGRVKRTMRETISLLTIIFYTSACLIRIRDGHSRMFYLCGLGGRTKMICGELFIRMTCLVKVDLLTCKLFC